MQMDEEGFENEGFLLAKRIFPLLLRPLLCLRFGRSDCDASGKVWSFDGINFSLRRVETTGKGGKKS